MANPDDAFFDLTDRDAVLTAIQTTDGPSVPRLQAKLLLDIRSLLVTLTRETMKNG